MEKIRPIAARAKRGMSVASHLAIGTARSIASSGATIKIPIPDRYI